MAAAILMCVHTHTHIYIYIYIQVLVCVPTRKAAHKFETVEKSFAWFRGCHGETAKAVARKNGTLFIWQHTERERWREAERERDRKGRRETVAAATHFM